MGETAVREQYGRQVTSDLSTPKRLARRGEQSATVGSVCLYTVCPARGLCFKQEYFSTLTLDHNGAHVCSCLVFVVHQGQGPAGPRQSLQLLALSQGLHHMAGCRVVCPATMYK